MMKEISVSEEYRIAATEILSILEYLPKSDVNKIPNKFKGFLKEISISDYNPNFDYSLGLDKIELKCKTKLLLAMIYRNYICSEQEKLEYDKLLYKNEEDYQESLREKYNPDNIFRKLDKDENINSEIPENTTNMTLIEYKEPIFIRFKNFIFRILHINK